MTARTDSGHFCLVRWPAARCSRTCSNDGGVAPSRMRTMRDCPLAEPSIGFGDDGDLQDDIDTQEQLLNFLGGDVLAASDDHV